MVTSRSKACRKAAASLLKTGFSTFHLSSMRTNQRTCCGSRPGFRKKKSKACRKPSRTCRKPGCKPGQKPGLQVCSWLEQWNEPLIQQYGDRYTGCWWVDCYIWYSEDGPAAPPLLAVPYGMGPENTGNSQSSSTVYRQVYEKTSTDDVTQASRRFRYSQVDRDLAADHKVSAGLRDSDLQQFPENCGRSAVLRVQNFTVLLHQRQSSPIITSCSVISAILRIYHVHFLVAYCLTL